MQHKHVLGITYIFYPIYHLSYTNYKKVRIFEFWDLRSKRSNWRIFSMKHVTCDDFTLHRIFFKGTSLHNWSKNNKNKYVNCVMWSSLELIVRWSDLLPVFASCTCFCNVCINVKLHIPCTWMGDYKHSVVSDYKWCTLCNRLFTTT